MDSVLTYLFADPVGSVPQVSLLFLLVACATLAGVLYQLWHLAAQRRPRHEQRKASADAAAASRSSTTRFPMPRLSLAEADGAQYKVEAEEPSRRTSTVEAEAGRALERSGVPASAEVLTGSGSSWGSGLAADSIDRREMVYIPAGEFWMGSDDKDDNEKPLHKQWVDAYYIDKYPVTNAEFALFVEETSYVTEAEQAGKGWVWQQEWRELAGASWRHPGGPSTSFETRLDHPVVLVSWNDARAYCRWAGKRLPTEAEWERASRGSDARKWPWGNEWDSSRLNSGEGGAGTTSPVGSYASGASPMGLHDVAGNVWEWVDEWYRPYPGSPCKDEDFGERYRVLRGGSWDSFGHNARCANRTRNLARACVNVNGFRCAASAPSRNNPSSGNQHEILVPARRILAGKTPEQMVQPLLRLRERQLAGAYDRSIAPAQLLEMGRHDIEVMQRHDPFLFRNGRKAHNLVELTHECTSDPETGRYHLRAGHFSAYLRLLGWKRPDLAETIARSYDPQRDLPYFLALVQEYARHLYLGEAMQAPSEEVLDTIVVHRRLASLLLRRAQVLIHAADLSEMVFIPEGEFIMGSTPSQLDEALALARIHRPEAVAAWFADEGPQHTPSIAAYLIDKYPVTNEQFERFVQASGYQAEGPWRKSFERGKDMHPVVGVTYADAEAYARWAGKALPTEQQWEKASRGTDGRKYPWGNRWDPSLLNSFEDGPRGTTPVGRYPEGASPYGLMDSLGNVWEWTGDLYLPYPSSSPGLQAESPRSKPGAAPQRAFRGGSWNNYHYNNRCANRHHEKPEYHSVSHGFRCARPVQPEDLRHLTP